MGLAVFVVQLLKHRVLLLLENSSSPNGSKPFWLNTRELGKRVQNRRIPARGSSLLLVHSGVVLGGPMASSPPAVYQTG